jgi:hypothetical protein
MRPGTGHHPVAHELETKMNWKIFGVSWDYIGVIVKQQMTGPFLERLFEMCCRHRFSWPHTGTHGQDYQVCLICGVVYEYDCSTMRRTGRVVAAEAARYLPEKQTCK